VRSVDYLGNSWSVDCATPSGSKFSLLMSSRAQVPAVNSPISIGWPPAFGFPLPLNKNAEPGR
jgi:hypothetical protein